MGLNFLVKESISQKNSYWKFSCQLLFTVGPHDQLKERHLFTHLLILLSSTLFTKIKIYSIQWIKQPPNKKSYWYNGVFQKGIKNIYALKLQIKTLSLRFLMWSLGRLRQAYGCLVSQLRKVSKMTYFYYKYYNETVVTQCHHLLLSSSFQS